jgi:hypothetical protein
LLTAQHNVPADLQGSEIFDVLPVFKITPELAKFLLERNSRNRKVRKHLVDRFANDMREGRWCFVGDPVVRRKSTGELISGQHRLLACVETGISFLAPIVDADEEAAATLDTGARRTAGDQLRMAFPDKIVNNTVCGAVIPRLRALRESGIAGYDRHRWDMSPVAICEYYEDMSEKERKRMNRALNIAGRTNHRFGGPASAVATAYMWACDVAPEKYVHYFFEQALLGGEGWLDAGTPQRSFGQYLTLQKGIHSTKADRNVLWAAVRAWNAWAREEKLTTFIPERSGRLAPIHPLDYQRKDGIE